MTLLSRLRRHRVALWMATAFLTVLGIAAAMRMPSGIYPEVEFPRIVVVARTGGNPPDVFLPTVTRPLEQALSSVLGLQRIRSKTIRGATEIALQFSPATDMWRALQLVESRIAEARNEVPAETEMVVEKVTTGSFPVMTFNVSGPVDPRVLREVAEYTVRPALANVPGVGRIDVLGGDIREIEVILDPDATSAMHLNPNDVAQKMRSAMGLSAVGRLERDRQVVTVMGDAQPRTIDDIGSMPIATTAEGNVVALRSIAEIVQGAEDRVVRVVGPEGDAVGISVARLPGASTPEVVLEVIAAARALSPTLPPGVTVEPVYDQAALVRESMASVRDAILLGIALCAAVIALFLRDLRAGALAALAVPITLAITFLVMHVLHETMNLMSLGGMAVAIGLVVDDAVVIVESIARFRDRGEPPVRAAELGTAEMAKAVIGTTVTTVVVFVPLAFLQGVVGEFFRSLALTLTSAVLISLVVALTLIPLAGISGTGPHAPRARSARWLLRYDGAVRFVIARPLAAVLAIVVVLGAGVIVAPRVARGFLPDLDEGAFVLDYFLPAGSSLATTEAFAQKLERELVQTPEVATFSRRTGAELGPATATQQSRGDIMVRLKPAAQRRRASEAIIADIRERVQRTLPEVRVEFVQVLQDVLNDLSGEPRPIEVKFFGADYEKLHEIADQFATELASLDGVVDVYNGHERESPELRFRAQRETLARLGVTPDEVNAGLEAALFGAKVGTVRAYDRLINVRVRYPNSVRFDQGRVLDIPFNARGQTSTFRAVTRPVAGTSASELLHEALQPMIAVTADRQNRDLGSIAKDVNALLARRVLPAGYRAALGGQLDQQRATIRELAIVAGFAVLLVLTVLSLQFRRFRLALLVLVSIPVAMVGALFGLVLTATPLNASSLMGLVLLVGLVVKNGVLLLEEAENQFDGGQDALEAVRRASERRLRPVIMTTLATVVGLLPLALGIGAGADIQRPLAIAVLAGLGASTIATLGLLPAFAARALSSAHRLT